MDLMTMLERTKFQHNTAEIKPFLNLLQIIDHLDDEYVLRSLDRLIDVISFMPSSSIVQHGEDLSNDIAYLHYSVGTTDYYITHRDRDTQQRNAFGAIDTGGMFMQMDYVSVHEILRAGAVLDFDWKPVPVKEIKTRSADF